MNSFFPLSLSLSFFFLSLFAQVNDVVNNNIDRPIMRTAIVLRLCLRPTDLFFFSFPCWPSRYEAVSHSRLVTTHFWTPVHGASNKIAFIMSIAPQCYPMKSFRSARGTDGILLRWQRADRLLSFRCCHFYRSDRDIHNGWDYTARVRGRQGTWKSSLIEKIKFRYLGRSMDETTFERKGGNNFLFHICETQNIWIINIRFRLNLRCLVSYLK